MDNDGLVDGDPFNVVSLLDVVLVAVSVGVEGHGLLGESGGGSEEDSLVNHFELSYRVDSYISLNKFGCRRWWCRCGFMEG